MITQATTQERRVGAVDKNERLKLVKAVDQGRGSLDLYTVRLQVTDYGMPASAVGQSEANILDAVDRAIKKIVPHSAKFRSCRMYTLTNETTSQYEGHITFASHTGEYSGQATGPDEVSAITAAYIAAINKYFAATS